jgi:hypothetical protein
MPSSGEPSGGGGTRRTAGVDLHEGAGNTITDPDARDARTDGDDLASAVGQRHGVVRQRSTHVVASDDGLVAVVQRRGAHSHGYLPVSGRVRFGQFHTAQLFDAGACFGNDMSAHGNSWV